MMFWLLAILLLSGGQCTLPRTLSNLLREARADHF